MSRFKALSNEEDRTARTIVQAAFRVHTTLGPGLLEHIYETCFCHELRQNGHSVSRQVCVDLEYDGVKLMSGLRLDVVVNNVVLCELKAVQTMLPVFDAQVLTYLKLTGKRLGFLINFNVPIIRNGIRRFIR